MASSLEVYRQRANFDVPKMQDILIGRDIVDFKNKVNTLTQQLSFYLYKQVWATLERDPLFNPIPHNLTLDQEREITFKRVKRLIEYDFLPDDLTMENPVLISALNSALMAYDLGTLAVYSLNKDVRLGK